MNMDLEAQVIIVRLFANIMECPRCGIEKYIKIPIRKYEMRSNGEIGDETHKMS